MPPLRRPSKLGAEELWQHALRLLGKRALSAQELRRKLTARAESNTILTEVMSKLREYNFLDDERFAESFAAARFDNRGYGSRRVLADLRSRQISGKIAEEAVQKIYRGADEEQLARQYLQRKYRGKDLAGLLSEQKHFLSAYRRLVSAGFTAKTCLAVLKQFGDHACELDLPEPEIGE